MAIGEHLKILGRGVGAWNDWREAHPEIQPDLSEAGLSGFDLNHTNFSHADLSRVELKGTQLISASFHRAFLSGANLTGANLEGAYLGEADLSFSNFYNANLHQALLYDAYIVGADFGHALLTDVELEGALLQGTNFSGTNFAGANIKRAVLRYLNLSGVKLEAATVGETVFDDVDLREAEGLESLKHFAPSVISLSTIYRSDGKFPERFLRGCGVPESFIVQIPALVASMQPIQFYSCFISYSGQDEEFARRLHVQMREAELRVWFAPEDVKGGDKLYDQIDRAIHLHDRLLLVLSEESLRSSWVETEIRRARMVERREGKQKLFPIRLVSYERLQKWTCIDSATGEDLAEVVRSYFIPDFSNWKNHDDFERAFARLLADLKASA